MLTEQHITPLKEDGLVKKEVKKMTYEEKYKKIVDYIYKELNYSQLKVSDKNTHPDFAIIQSGKILALNCLIWEIKKMEESKK